MYSDSELRRAVTEGRIRLSYKFFPPEGGRCWVEGQERFADSDEVARRLFEAQITRSRLGLHLGCLVQPLSSTRRVRRSQRFDHLRSVVDLRKCGDDGWLLSPGSSAVAFTNEWLDLPYNAEGLVASRVGDYNAGLVVTGSYIDSTWRGLTKLLLTNNGRRAVRLYVGLEVARLFFVETDGASEDDHGVTRDTGHYEKSWDEILAGGVDPFPQPNTPVNRFTTASVRNVNEIFKNYAGYTVIGALLLAGSLVYRTVSGVATSSKLESQAEVLQTAVEVLARRAPRSGVVTVSLQPRSSRGEANVDMGRADVYSPSESFVTVETVDGRDEGVSATLLFLGDGKAHLVVTVVDPAPVTERKDYEVKYLVVP